MKTNIKPGYTLKIKSKRIFHTEKIDIDNWDKEAKEMCGKRVTVDRITDGGFYIKEDGGKYWWRKWQIDLKSIKLPK